MEFIAAKASSGYLLQSGKNLKHSAEEREKNKTRKDFLPETIKQ